MPMALIVFIIMMTITGAVAAYGSEYHSKEIEKRKLSGTSYVAPIQYFVLIGLIFAFSAFTGSCMIFMNNEIPSAEAFRSIKFWSSVASIFLFNISVYWWTFEMFLKDARGLSQDYIDTTPPVKFTDKIFKGNVELQRYVQYALIIIFATITILITL